MPQLGFNYLGRFGSQGDRQDAGRPVAAPEAGGRFVGDPAMALAHLIEINALTLDGAEGPALFGALDLCRRRCWVRLRLRDLAADLVPGA